MAITLDGTPQSTSGASNGATQTLGITIGNNGNRCLVVCIQQNNGASTAITSVKIGSTAFTHAVTQKDSVGTNDRSEIWYLTSTGGLGTGAVTITVTFGVTATPWSIGAYSLYNVDQGTTIGVTAALGSGFPNPSNANGTITPTHTGAWIIDSVATQATSMTASLTQGWNLTQASGFLGGSQYSSNPTINSANAMNWTNTGGLRVWDWCAVEVISAPPSVSISDTLNVVETVSKNIGKYISDSLSLSENIQISIGVAVSDAIGITDSIHISKAAQAVSDNILTTDIVSISKTIVRGVVDNMVSSDSISKSVGKRINDSPLLADNLSKSVAKSISDNMNIIDSISKNINKLIIDSMSINDNTAKTLVKQIVDSLSIIDSVTLARSIVRQITDNLSMGDSVSKQFARILQDNPQLADNLSKAVGKIITDGITLSESEKNTIGSLMLTQIRKVKLNNATKRIMSEGKPRNVII